MNYVRVDTWKYSTVYGRDYPWANRWYFRVPFNMHDEVTYSFLKFVIQIEKELHFNHVRYDAATMILAQDEGNENPDNGITFLPDYGNHWGFWNTVSDPAPYDHMLKVARYVDAGKCTYWWFRGSLLQTDLSYTDEGKLLYKGFQNWRNILYNWEWYFWYYWGVYQVVPYGINATGAPMYYSDVKKLLPQGVIRTARITRANTNYTSQGWNLYRDHFELQHEFGLWVLQFGAWKTQSGDAAPCLEINSQMDYWLGRIKAHANQISSWLSGGSESGTGSTGAVLRFGPNNTEATRIVEQIISKVPEDLEQIHAMPCYGGGSGSDYMLHTYVMEINEIIYDYLGRMAQLSLLDYRNPANS